MRKQAHPILDWIERHIADNPGCTVHDIVDALKLHRSAVLRGQKRLRREGKVYIIGWYRTTSGYGMRLSAGNEPDTGRPAIAYSRTKTYRGKMYKLKRIMKLAALRAKRGGSNRPIAPYRGKY